MLDSRELNDGYSLARSRTNSAEADARRERPLNPSPAGSL